MQSSRVILQFLCTAILGFSVSLSLKAQPAFSEGVLTYKADTVRRLEASPAGYIISQVVVYKKLDQLRIETLRVNKFNRTDIQKYIQIRNKKGIYLFLESSDSIRNAVANFAMFISYEEEKTHRANRILNGSTSNYKVDKVLKNIKWLNLPAQKLRLKGGQNEEESEIVFTNSLDIPIGLVLDSPLAALSGTPLEFVHCEHGWMTRLSADKLKLEKVSTSLFQIDPKLKIMSNEEVLQGVSDFK
jgi:hypothetical protein